MNPRLKRLVKILFSPFHRVGLKNRDFTIISNNCWGGFYYDRYHLRYLSPTIGLFIPPKDYLKFIADIKKYLDYDDLVQVNVNESKHRDMLLRKQEANLIGDADHLIIGKLLDIEIIFLHYTSFEDAKQKWNRRKQRINWGNIVFKFNDQNEFEREDLDVFLKIPVENKIFFTSDRSFLGLENVVVDFNAKNDRGYIFDDMHVKKFNFKKYINSIRRT